VYLFIAESDWTCVPSSKPCLLTLLHTTPLLLLLLLPQHARGLEAISKLIPLAPELLVPLLITSFECMAAVPLEQSGQLPPPAKVTLQWKEDAMARLAMAKVGWNDFT
jgi:hypothetical protein